jgi:hypothetical protein
MTKNEIHLSKRKKKQGETKDDVCDIGNDPVFLFNTQRYQWNREPNKYDYNYRISFIMYRM